MTAHIYDPKGSPKQDVLRVSVHEHDIQSLLERYPKLTRTEVVDIIGRHGPMRLAVEDELKKLSALKR
jgi:hypothetical protein